MYESHYMVVNILLMVWIAFNIAWLLDVTVTNWQFKKHKANLPRLRQSENWNYAKWKKGVPRLAFKFEITNWWIWAIGFPCIITVAACVVGMRLIASFYAATQAFFSTFFETLREGK